MFQGVYNLKANQNWKWLDCRKGTQDKIEKMYYVPWNPNPISQDKTGQLTVAEFKECLQEAGLRLRQNELNRLVDKLNLQDKVPHKYVVTRRDKITEQN